MARISLRAYQRDIEELVETHQFDQAIAHCRHILRFYPKEVNTYRLLGKAYLESQRYGDASDIFIRVLSTIPDDFVSHVGMSIIREDEANLDEAIWHMQRAFETQPANSAIQGELRRLHGRREGIEPPKIRLTRGALARMYLKGELFAQALVELRAGLHEDPKRYDLQIVLAQAYYLAGQRVDAAETCSTLLKSLPFCLEANKILADILSHSERSGEAQVYSKRVESLDPYMAHLSPTASTPEKVADTAVLLEKLEWRPGIQTADMIQQPEWATSLGVDLGTVTGPESVPDWLAGTETLEPHAENEAIKPFEDAPLTSDEQVPIVNDAVPDWMKEAGWTESRAPTDQEGFLPLSEAEGIEGDLEPAEIPEWLKTMAPSVSDDTGLINPPPEPVSEPSEEPVQSAVLPWLDETPPGPTDSVAMWLENQETPASIDDQLDFGSTNLENIPDWLQDLGEPVVKVSPLEESPAESKVIEEILTIGEEEDDQSNIGAAAALAAAAGLVGADQTEEESQEEIPSGLADEIQSEVVLSADVSDWLQELGSVDAELAVEPEYSESPIESEVLSLEAPLAEAQIPEWLQNLEPLSEAKASQSPASSEISLTDSSAPVEDLIVPTEATTGIEEKSEDWVMELGEVVPAEESQLDGVETTMTGEPQSIEDEEAFAWLENLAARQGAEEALLLSPDERRDTPPDWIVSEAGEHVTLEVKEESTPEIFEAAILATAITDSMSEENEAIIPEEPAGISPAEQQETGIEPETITASEPAMVVETAEAEPEPVESSLEEVIEMSAAAEMLSGIEQTVEDEMLFYPLETAEFSEKPLPLDEGPIEEDDTKPTAIQAGTGKKIEAIAATAVIGSIVETDEDLVPTPSSVVEEETTGLPELVEEQPQFGELPETGGDILEPSNEPEKPIAEGVVIPEEDEAFAWLESLAARQGAEEALLLTPEERLESPPEWVIQEAAEAEESRPADTLGDAELPEWLKEAPGEAQEAEPTAGIETEIPDWLTQPAGIAKEPTMEGELPPLAPELPTWLAGIEDTQKETETTVWSPTDESNDGIETEAIQDTTESASEEPMEPAPIPTLDLNKAGLVDLERLPGVGFTRAQAILDYREQHGLYQDLDELLLVAGITPDLLFELKQLLNVGGAVVTAAVEPPAEDHQILLVQARNALVQGDIPLAISRYRLLIDKRQMLPDVITDLNEALYRFPIDVSIWEALGDTHMHAGHLQEALNAYTKAEEYLH